MNRILLYKQDGSIFCLFSGPNITDAEATAEANECQMVNVDLESVDPHLKYWDGEKISDKADYSLDNLPTPCTIWIEGIEYRCNVQPEFEFDAPGKYRIKVNAGATYLEKEFEIDYQP